MADTWISTDQATLGEYEDTDTYEGYCFCGAFVAPSGYTCNRLGIYSFADPGADLYAKLAVYADSAGAPTGTPLQESAPILINAADQWFDVDISDLSISNGVTYHMGMIMSKMPSADWRRRDPGAPSGDSHYASGISYPTFPTSPDTGPSSRRYGAFRMGYAEVPSGEMSGTATITINASGELTQPVTEWLSDWKYRREITVSNTNIDSNLTHFPALLTLGSSVGIGNDNVTSIFDELGSDSKKIAITKTDGVTQLYAEIEEWDDSGETAVLWVSKSDLILTSGSSTSLYFYYDSSKDDNTTYIGDTKGSTPVTNVWDSNFGSVWHLNETSGGSGAIKDSIGNDNGTDLNSPTLESTGQIGNAIEFNTGDSEAIDLDGSGYNQGAFTVKMWINPQSGVAQYQRALTFGPDDNTTRSFLVVWITGTSDNPELQGIVGTGEAPAEEASNVGGEVSQSTWTHWVWTFDGGTAHKLYVNSVDTNSTGLGTGLGITGSTYIASRNLGSYFDGIIDEVTISNSVRNAAWVKAEFYSETDDLVTWGGEDPYPGTTYTVTFHCGANGTLTGADATQSVSPGGDSTSITATADGTHVFDGWTGDHVSLINPLQLTNVTSDKDVTSNYGLWGINNPNYMYRSDNTQCLFCGCDTTDYTSVICDCSSVPYPITAGVREGAYGLASDEATHEDWTNGFWGMHWRTGRADKVGLWNISHIIGNDCQFGFIDPGDTTDVNITFTGSDIHSSLFTQFDSDGDIDIYLALELGEADPTECIEVALNQYGDHSCVKGILIDLEWWNVDSGGNYSVQLPKATAESWLSTIQGYDENYKLITRHPKPEIHPPPTPAFDEDIWVNCDDQGFIELGDSTTTGDFMIPMFKTFCDTFPDHTCIFQIGYNSIWGDGGETRNDKDWWGGYDNPPTTIIDAIKDYIITPRADSTSQSFGITWVDFSLEDEEIDLLDTPDSTALWGNCELHNFAIADVKLNLPANSPVCSCCDTSGKACW
jgi:hypothetical protein